MSEFPRVHEFHGTPERTVEEILEMAEAEGAEVGHRQGRVTARGTSPALTRLIKAHERELVEHLGGRFRVSWQ